MNRRCGWNFDLDFRPRVFVRAGGGSDLVPCDEEAGMCRLVREPLEASFYDKLKNSRES